MDSRLSTILRSFRMATFSAGILCRPRDAGCQGPQLRLVADSLFPAGNGHPYGVGLGFCIEPVREAYSFCEIIITGLMWAIS